MAGFTSVDQYVEAVASLGQGDFSSFFKIGTAPDGTATFYSFWKDPGGPGAGTNPAGTPGTAYDLDAGGLWAWADVEGGGAERYLGELELMASQPCTLFIYDRLVGVGGLSVATTGNKTCATTALTRYTNGLGVEAWVEFSTAGTANTGVITLNDYTDNDGNTGQTGTSVSMPSTTPNIGTLVRLPLAAGDRGVRAVNTINVGTATTTGVVNLVLMKRIAAIPVKVNAGTPVNLLSHMAKLPRIYDGCTPMLVMYSQNANATTVHGSSGSGYR